MGTRPFKLCYLSSMKNCCVTDVLIHSGGSSSLSVNICPLLSDRKTTYVMALLSWIGEFEFRLGRRDAHCWSPITFLGLLLQLFPLMSFLPCLLDPSSFRKYIFSSLWKIKIPNKKKLRLFAWQVIHGRVNALDWLLRKMRLLVGSFCCFSVEEHRKTGIIYFGNATLIVCMGLFFGGFWFLAGSLRSLL